LTYKELRERFELNRATERGLLPSIYFSDNPRADLQSYAGTYFQQEIVSEGATRNVPAFSRFLKVAALCNGTIVNFTNVANDAQVKRSTVYKYFEILKDTLVLHELPAWRKTRKRKPLASSKYYFFDVGVVASLQGRRFRPSTPEFGEALESYLMHELTSYSDYVSEESLAYWRSTSGFEVDFIIGEHTAIGGQGEGKRRASGPKTPACSRRGKTIETLSVRKLGTPRAQNRRHLRSPPHRISRSIVEQRIQLVGPGFHRLYSGRARGTKRLVSSQR
jgi:predicted AAA+ superfamily ATPase